MSGSGGGTGYIPGGSVSSCETLTIHAQMASPQPAVISKLKVGDKLRIELTPPLGPVQLVTADNEVAGAVLSSDVAQLINCINDGHEYQAKILEIKGANCQILITHS